MTSREMNGKDGSKTNSRDFLVGAFIGALAGATAAFLFTPKSGKDLRTTINGQTISILEKTDKVKDKALSKSTEIAAVAKEKASTVVSQVAHQSQELFEKVRDKQGDSSEHTYSASTNSEEIQRKLEETQRAFDETEIKLNH